jgi:hypothetical protein
VTDRTRRRAVLGVLAVGLALLGGVVGAPGAAAAPTCPADSPLTSVKVSTVPVVPGATIDLGGTKVTTDGAGQASAQVCRLTSARDITGPTQPIELAGHRRAVYDRVYITDRGRSVQAAFGMESEVSFAFSGLPTKQIASFTLRSSTGEVLTQKTLDPIWLPSARVLRGPDGLEERKIYYSVDSVFVAGSSVVNRSQVKFYPADRAVIRVPLLAYTVRVEVVDRLFRWPVGDAVQLTRKDAFTVGQPLKDGVATFTEVPRGNYAVVADAPGLRINRSLILSRDQVVVMPVLTWVDLVVLLGLPLLIALGLVLAPRPDLRRRLRSVLPGTRPRNPATATE